jgi:hypothetical protein
MKKFLVGMIVSCFSFWFICPASAGFSDFFSKEKDKQCEEAVRNFNNISERLLAKLEIERELLKEQTKISEVQQVRTDCEVLNEGIQMMKKNMLVVCNKNPHNRIKSKANGRAEL